MADTIDPTMQKMLLDFNKTITENPKISDADLYNKYPELGNDEKMLAAAYDYSATLNSPKYKSPEEFNDKFPEFALKKKGQTEPSTSSSEQTKPVSTSGLPSQKEVSQSGGEKQPSDWSKRYVDKLREYDKKNPVNALALTEEQKKNVFIEKPGSGSTVLPTTLEDVTKARDILLKNKDKNFVQRALNPTDYPSIKLPDGDNATHKMAYAEVDGKYIVYPTIIQDDKGDLKELDGDKAIDHALKNGEYISFDNEKDAGWFSENYKSIWKEAEQKDKIDKRQAIENFDFFSLAKEQPSEQAQRLSGDFEAVKYSQASLNDAQQSRDKLAMEEIVLTPDVSDITISANSLNLVNSLGVNPDAGYSKILEERINYMQQKNPGLYNYTKEKVESPVGLTETQKFNMISKGLSDKMAEVNTNLDRANAKGYKDIYEELSSFISEKGDNLSEQDKAYVDGYYQQNKDAIDTYEALLKQGQAVSDAYTDLLADFPESAKRIREQKEVNKALKDKVMTLNEPIMYVDDNGDVKWTMAGAASTMALNKLTDALVDIGTFGAKLRNMGEAYAGTANSYSEADMLVDKFTDVVDNKLKLIEDANGLYDEKGNFNKSKIAKTIASATMDMGILMAGASKGTAVAKALGASEKVAANTALFSASFMQQYPDIEKDLMDRGVSPEDAVKVAMGMTTALSLMELINPNPDIMATINKGAFTKALTEGAVKEIAKGGENLGSRIIRKTIDYTADVTGENVQELSSLITEKLGNAAANNMLESQLTSKLETNISDKEIMETILATTGATLALKSLSKGGNDYIDNLLTASKRPEAFASVMNALLERGEVTPAEALSVTKTLEQIQLANAKIPEDLNPSVKNKVIPLVLEKTKLEEKKANTDAAFHEDIDAKISGVNEQIKSVINEKQTTDELQGERQREGQGQGNEITQPPTETTTVESPVTETPVVATEKTEGGKDLQRQIPEKTSDEQEQVIKKLLPEKSTNSYNDINNRIEFIVKQEDNIQDEIEKYYLNKGVPQEVVDELIIYGEKIKEFKDIYPEAYAAFDESVVDLHRNADKVTSDRIELENQITDKMMNDILSSFRDSGIKDKGLDAVKNYFDNLFRTTDFQTFGKLINRNKFKTLKENLVMDIYKKLYPNTFKGIDYYDQIPELFREKIGVIVDKSINKFKSKLTEQEPININTDNTVKDYADKYKADIDLGTLDQTQKDWIYKEVPGQERPFKFDTVLKNQGRFRLIPPENLDNIKTATVENTVAEDLGLDVPKVDGISYTVGTDKNTGKGVVQSIRFDTKVWTEDKAAKWFNDNRKQFTFNAKKPTMTEMKSKQDYQKELEQQSFERVSKSVKAIGQYMVGKKKTEAGEPINVKEAIKDIAKEAYYLGALNIAQYTDKIRQIIKKESGTKVSDKDIDMVLSENDDLLLEEYSKLKKEGRPNVEKVVAEYESRKSESAVQATNKTEELTTNKTIAKDILDDLKNRTNKEDMSEAVSKEFEKAYTNIENAGTQQQIDNAINAIKNKFDYTGEYNTLVSKAKKEQSNIKKRYNKGEFEGNKDVKAVIKKILNIDFDKIKKAGYNLSNDFLAMFNEKLGDVTEGKVVDVAPLSELMDKYESAIDIAQNRNIVTDYDNINSIDEAIDKLEKLKESIDKMDSGEEISVDELRSMMRQARSLENKAKRLLSVGLLHMSEGKIIDATTKLNELVDFINSGVIASFKESVLEKEQEYVIENIPEVAENIYSVEENMQGEGGDVFDRFQKEQIKKFKDYIRKSFLMGDDFISESFTADRLEVLNDIAEQLKLGLVTTQMYSEMEKIGSDMLKTDIRDNVAPMVKRWQLNVEEYVKKLNSKDTISWDMAFKMGLKGGEVLDKFFLGYAKSASANFVNNLAVARHDVDKSVAKLYNAFSRRIKYGLKVGANAEVQMRMIGMLKAQLDYISNMKENFSVVESMGEFKIYNPEGSLISTVSVENYGKENYTEQDYINALKKVDQEKTRLSDQMVTNPDMSDRMFRLIYGDKKESFKSAKLSESVVKNNAKLLADKIAYDELTGNTLAKGKDNGKRLDVKTVDEAKKKLNNLQKDVFDALTNFINEHQGMIEQISQREGVPFVRRENYWPAYVSESTVDYVDNSKSIEQAFNPADMKPAIKTKSINARTGVLKYTDNNAYKMFERYANKLYMDYYLAPEYTRESQALTKLSKEYRADDTTKEQFVLPEALKAAITNQWKMQVNGRPILSKRERAISLGGVSYLDFQSFIRKALRISSMRQLLSVFRPVREVVVWPIKMAGYTEGFNMSAMNPFLRGAKKKFSTFRDEYLTGAYASMKAAERKTSGDILNADTSVPMALEAFAKRNIINSGDYLTGNITFMNEFMNGFKKETGEKFDIDKALNDEEYRNKHLLDFERATNYANRQIEFIYVPQTSFGQAFSAWPFGEQKTFFNTIMRMLSTFQIRESLNFWEDGYRMMVNGDKESAIRFAKSVPAMATANYMYWALGQFAVAATRYMASDDEEEKEKIKERVEGMFTPEGVAKGYTQAAVGLITGAYGGISKIALWAGYSFYRNIYAGADAKAQLREDLGRDGKPKKTVKELDAEWRAIDDQVRGMLNVTPLMLTGYTDAEKQIENIASNLFPVFGSLVVDIKNSGKDIADLVAKGANEELQGDDLALYEVLSIGAMLASFVVANPASKETNAIINQLRREAEKDLKNMEESSKKRNKTKTTRFSNTGSSNTGGSNQSSSNNRRSNN